MPFPQQDTVQIPNASWWEPNSHVLVKEDFLEEDQAWIQNQIVSINAGNDGKNTVTTRAGNLKSLKIQRMVVSGRVDVKRSSGRIKSVILPHEAGKLLANDANYIDDEIDKLNAPLTPGEQQDFLPSANGLTPVPLPMENPSQT